METPWRMEMRFHTAALAAREWLARLRLELSLAGQPVVDLWLRPGPFEGYDFVPLDSVESLTEEAVAMENCVRKYAHNIAANWCRLWSIRKDGQRIADLEIRRSTGRPLIYMDELLAARNQDAPIEIWWLATRWLHQHDLMSIRPEDPRGYWLPDGAAWRKLWRPYWLAKRQFPGWLPLGPSWAALEALRK
jgi:hypothetical protein